MNKTLKDNFKEALLTTQTGVNFCDHVTDNSFLYFEIEKTIDAMNKLDLLPLAICLRPEYGDENDYGFSFFNLQKGESHWIHITKHLAQSWLRQLEITPPKDILWENETWEKYIWNYGG